MQDTFGSKVLPIKAIKSGTLSAVVLTLGCASNERVPSETVSSVRSLIPEQRLVVEAFFGGSFPSGFETVIAPDRNAFADLTESRWGFRAEPCWMVATGTGSIFAMIDPQAWTTEACEHDPSDAEHIRRLITHELVHVYHGQHNADPEFNDLAPLGWFVEGLAVYASGQFDDPRQAQAAHAEWPDSLENAWAGPSRYAVCGAIVAWIDEQHGRATLVDLLSAQSTAEALASLAIDERDLLDEARNRARSRTTDPL